MMKIYSPSPPFLNDVTADSSLCFLTWEKLGGEKQHIVIEKKRKNKKKNHPFNQPLWQPFELAPKWGGYVANYGVTKKGILYGELRSGGQV